MGEKLSSLLPGFLVGLPNRRKAAVRASFLGVCSLPSASCSCRAPEVVVEEGGLADRRPARPIRGRSADALLWMKRGCGAGLAALPAVETAAPFGVADFEVEDGVAVVGRDDPEGLSARRGDFDLGDFDLVLEELLPEMG